MEESEKRCGRLDRVRVVVWEVGRKGCGETEGSELCGRVSEGRNVTEMK